LTIVRGFDTFIPMTAQATGTRFIRTVLGDIPASQAGFAHCHEHTFILPGRSAEVDRELRLDDREMTTAELREFHAIGGRTVVDAQPIGQERAPRLQRLASEQSGVHILATTGFHQEVYYDPNHFRFRETAEALAARMIEEIASGMAIYAGDEVIERTDIRAGLVKFASGYHVISAQARKAAEAAAATHHATGAPVLTHTERGTCGLETVELFERLGVSPCSLLLSHLDRNPDVYMHQDVAATGAYMVYDGISRVHCHPDSTLVQLIGQMVELGYARQILLGMDMGPRRMWRAYGGGPGMTYLAGVFLAKLRRAGVAAEVIDGFTTRNPAVALAFREGGPTRAS
jgi:5-phospho-D-xylono-1,4-lactonase